VLGEGLLPVPDAAASGGTEQNRDRGVVLGEHWSETPARVGGIAAMGQQPWGPQRTRISQTFSQQLCSLP